VKKPMFQRTTEDEDRDGLQNIGFLTAQPFDLADSPRKLHHTQSPGKHQISLVTRVFLVDHRTEWCISTASWQLPPLSLQSPQEELNTSGDYSTGSAAGPQHFHDVKMKSCYQRIYLSVLVYIRRNHKTLSCKYILCINYYKEITSKGALYF
jgi:hypothetical protein